MSNLRASKQHPREENNQTYPVEAALELALPLAGHGDGRGPLLELAGAGLPMRGALAVLLPLALVLLHHVELGHGVAADGFGFAGAAAGEEGARERGETSKPFGRGLYPPARQRTRAMSRLTAQISLREGIPIRPCKLCCFWRLFLFYI